MPLTGIVIINDFENALKLTSGEGRIERVRVKNKANQNNLYATLKVKHQVSFNSMDITAIGSNVINHRS